MFGPKTLDLLFSSLGASKGGKKFTSFMKLSTQFVYFMFHLYTSLGQS